MRILITNDDGLFADGILTLAAVLEQEHDVTVVAPHTQRSAQSHAITILTPMVIRQQQIESIQSRAYSVGGTPADCVRAGIEAFGKEQPFDLVVSGINFGLNAGMDVLYSGTVSAAVEANLYGLPSIAASAAVRDNEASFEAPARLVADYIQKNGEALLEHKILLNMNFPYEMEDPPAFQIAKIGDPIFDLFVLEEDGEDLTLTATGRKEIRYAEGTDRYFLHNGQPTITPLQYNFTNHEWMERLRSWNA